MARTSLRTVSGRSLLAVVLLTLVVGPRTRASTIQQPETVDLDALFAEAQNAYRERRWEAAEKAYATIRDLARQRGDELLAARGVLGVGSVDASRERFTDARTELLDALAVFERHHATSFAATTNDMLARIAKATNDYPESASRWRLAMDAFEATGNRPGRAYAAVRLASVDRELRNRADLDRAFSQATDEARRLGDASMEGEALHSWGDRLFLIGEFEPAIGKLEDAATLFEKIPDTESLARVYTSLGRLYRVHGQPGAALKYQLKSVEIVERVGSPRVYVQSLNAVGVAYQALGESAKARQYYERALAAAEGAGLSQVADFIRANLAGFLVNIGEAERARPMLEAIVARRGDLYMATRYNQLASAYFQLGRYEDARIAGEHALEECSSESALECVFARLRIADAELALGHESSALDHYHMALGAIEDIHGKLAATDFLKQGFYQSWAATYTFGIALQFRRGDYRGALETAELARSRGFLDLLASHDIDQTPRALPEMPLLAVRGPAPTTLRSQAVASAPTTGELAATAARLHSTILAYWVGGDRVYSWVVTPGGAVSGTSVKISSVHLTELIRATVPFATADESVGSAKTTATRGDQSIALAPRRNPAWRELYDLLVGPVERYLPRTPGARLTIVPHGPLLHVPFAALRDREDRYFIERYTIHSVPAAAVLQFTNERRRTSSRSGRFLLVADPSSPPRTVGEPPLARLPGAAVEAQAIAHLVPPARSTLLTAANATEARVRDALAERAVVHFATHAIVRDGDPLTSFLALDATPGTDGRLTAEKIYKLRLDADLVVLSACRSGEGVVTGDGIAGLARAFFYAGAPSLVVSLWDVADAPTSRLVPAFYRAWLGGADKARALRSAQLALIRDLRAGRVTVSTAAGPFAIPEDPAFWAGFVLLGEPD